MFPIGLDIRTLSLITVLLSFGFGSSLIVFGIVHPAFSGLKRVGSGLVLIGLAFLLISFRDHISPALSLVAANTILVLGFMLMNLGIHSFRFRQIPRPDAWLGAIVVVAALLTMSYFTYIEPSFTQRVFWVCSFLVVLSGMCCRNVLKKSTSGVIMPQGIIALGFGLFGVYMLVRAWWVLDENTMQDFMKAGTIHGLAFLAMILLLLSVAFGLVWMANEYLLKELKQYEQIILTSPEGIALVDREGRYQLVNNAILKFLNLSRQEILGKSSLDLFGRSVYEEVTLPNVQKAFAGETGESTTWLELPDAEKLYVAITYHPVPDSKGKNAFAAIHIKNLTELYQAQREKQRIFYLSLDMLCVTGMDGQFREVNPSWTKTLGWSQDELLQSKWTDYVHPDDLPKTLDIEHLLKKGQPVVDFVNRCRTKDGMYKYISWMSSPEMETKMIYCVARDITDRIRREEELVVLATVDPLTGANNRRLFMERLNDEVKRSARYNNPLSLITMDIDHFKNINDSHGHAVGDNVLIKLVDICSKVLRDTDIFGRVGGEEFSAALPFADIDHGYEAGERLRKELSQCFVDAENGIPAFTVSIGVAELRPDDSTESFLKRADDALYRAKEGGRDRVERA